MEQRVINDLKKKKLMTSAANHLLTVSATPSAVNETVTPQINQQQAPVMSTGGQGSPTASCAQTIGGGVIPSISFVTAVQKPLVEPSVEKEPTESANNKVSKRKRKKESATGASSFHMTLSDEDDDDDIDEQQTSKKRKSWLPFF
jgi:hypothetical protein